MDKEQLFSIGEVARLFHMSVSSLRHYESLGLLS
ncbi:MAG: MerR family DNA-binding transcriptional regulator [Oscillospiraceae bacterium]